MLEPVAASRLLKLDCSEDRAELLSLVPLVVLLALVDDSFWIKVCRSASRWPLAPCPRGGGGCVEFDAVAVAAVVAVEELSLVWPLVEPPLPACSAVNSDCMNDCRA